MLRGTSVDIVAEEKGQAKEWKDIMMSTNQVINRLNKSGNDSRVSTWWSFLQMRSLEQKNKGYTTRAIGK